MFPQATPPQPPYQLGDTILAFGVLVPKNAADPPFFWHKALKITPVATPRG